jgi:uncharacterized protein
MKVLNFAGRGRPPGGRRRDDLPPPGSLGEHILQERLGTQERASQFYAKQFRDRLTPRMVEFLGRMEMAFIATSDAVGECDCSFRAGTPGFLRVLDERTIAYPEFRGNGVQWVLVRVAEAYIHCSKHIPKLVPQSRVRHWGTDNPRHKGGDYFGAEAQKAAELEAEPVPAGTVVATGLDEAG